MVTADEHADTSAIGNHDTTATGNFYFSQTLGKQTSARQVINV